MKGPAAGILVLTKDGTTYDEFYDIHFKYNKIRYSKNFDFFYPSELEFTVKKGKEKLHLCCTMTVESREDVQKLSRKKSVRSRGLWYSQSGGSNMSQIALAQNRAPLPDSCRNLPRKDLLQFYAGEGKDDLKVVTGDAQLVNDQQAAKECGQLLMVEEE